MTNKPMLSVELRKALADFVEYSVPGPRSDDAMWYKDKQELRAFLDSRAECRCKRYGKDNPNWPCPVHDESAAQHQGEPVAWRYKKSWEKTGWKVCDKHPTDYGIDDECYEIQALYAEQPAPVAGQAQCEECKGWGYHENHHEGGGTECGECGGSGSATVAVVMPEHESTNPYWPCDSAEEKEEFEKWRSDKRAYLDGVKP